MPTSPLDPAGATVLTFDCYGTLIDWEAGTIEALRPLLARHGVALSDDEIVTAAQEIEEPLCEPPYRPYRAVLAGVVEGFGRRFGFPVGAAERDLLAASVPSWRPFPDTVEALRALAHRYRLAVISKAASSRRRALPGAATGAHSRVDPHGGRGLKKGGRRRGLE